MYARAIYPLPQQRTDRSKASHYQRRSTSCVQIHCRLYHWCLRRSLALRRLLTCHAERINTFNPTTARPFVLGLPTGSSPVLIYQELVKRHKAGEISFRNVVTFNMVGQPLPIAITPVSLRGTAYITEPQAHPSRTSTWASREIIPRVITVSCTNTSSLMST